MNVHVHGLRSRVTYLGLDARTNDQMKWPFHRTSSKPVQVPHKMREPSTPSLFVPLPLEPRRNHQTRGAQAQVPRAERPSIHPVGTNSKACGFTQPPCRAGCKPYLLKGERKRHPLRDACGSSLIPLFHRLGRAFTPRHSMRGWGSSLG